ncbi:MAG: hypothetical protein WDM90_04500 [Ferruginibacter sp.]
MKVYHQVHPEDFSSYKTAAIREKFLVENLLSPDKIECVYTHYRQNGCWRCLSCKHIITIGHL